MAKPIPDGFRTLTPYLCVVGAADAIEFYKKAFGAIERYRMPAPDGKRLMHAEIQIGDSILMICDAFPEWGSNASAATNHIYVENADAFAEQAVKAGAKVVMPVMEMFWGDRFGKVTDPFGQSWSIATHVKDLSPQEMQAAAAKAFSQPCPDGKK